jgi:hypothetical protein
MNKMANQPKICPIFKYDTKDLWKIDNSIKIQ